MRADVERGAGGLGDAADHAVGIAAVGRLSTLRPQDERASAAFTATGSEDPEDGDRDRHGGGLLPLPTRCRTRCPRRLSR